MAEAVSLALPVSLDDAAPILAGEDASTTTPPAAGESAGTPPVAAATSSDNEDATAASAFGTTTDDETPTREDRSESGVDASGEENAVSSPDVASSDDGEKSPSGPSVVISAPEPRQKRAPAAGDPNAEVGSLVCKGDRHSEVEPFRGTLLPSHLTASHSVGCFSPQTASSDPPVDGEGVETENSAGNNNNNDHHHRLSHLRHHHRGGGAGTGSSSAQDLTMMAGSTAAATSNGVIEGLELSAKLRESMFTVDKINFDEPLIDPGEKYKDLLYPADEPEDDDGVGDGVTVLTCDDNPNLEATALLKNSNSKVTVTISPEGLRWVQHSVPVIPSGLKVAESSGALLKVRFVVEGDGRSTSQK